jgi:hypothetical protein
MIRLHGYAGRSGVKNLRTMRLSQNFSFWGSRFKFRGKDGLLAAFSKISAFGKAVLNLREKAGAGLFFQEPLPRPSGSWGKFLLLLLCVLFSPLPAMAEDLRNVYIWVHPVEGGSEREKQYFYNNIQMEMEGSGYKLAESRENSDFYMNIQVVHEEKDGAPPNYVNLTLYDSRTEKIITTLSWDYNTLEDMDIWTPYLVFQSMANAPIAKLVVIPEGELPPPPEEPAWYSKWLWIGAAGGADYFSNRPHLDARLTLGVDLFSFMGLDTGLGYQADFPLFVDTAKDEYYHEIEQSLILPIKLRFLIKTENLLVEPNGGINFQFRFPGSYSGKLEHRTPEDSLVLFPAVFGGLDFRAKLGPGALVFGPRLTYDFEAEAFGFGFTLGYQFGLFPKKSKAPKPEPASLIQEESLGETGGEEVSEETLAPEGGPEETALPERSPAGGGPEETPPENPADF